jgi:hypothetical protein
VGIATICGRGHGAHQICLEDGEGSGLATSNRMRHAVAVPLARSRSDPRGHLRVSICMLMSPEVASMKRSKRGYGHLGRTSFSDARLRLDCGCAAAEKAARKWRIDVANRRPILPHLGLLRLHDLAPVAASRPASFVQLQRRPHCKQQGSPRTEKKVKIFRFRLRSPENNVRIFRSELPKASPAQWSGDG